MPEVLTERDLTRELFDQGCEKYGIVPFMREANTLMHQGHRVNDALRGAGAAIDLRRLKEDVVEAAKAFVSDENAQTYASFRSATQALIDFESQHVKK